jgi:hypothetical protein
MGFVHPRKSQEIPGRGVEITSTFVLATPNLGRIEVARPSDAITAIHARLRLRVNFFCGAPLHFVQGEQQRKPTVLAA